MPAPLLIAAALLLGACTHTRPVGDFGPATLARHAEGRRVTVVLADGRAFPADALRVDADSVSWIDPASRALGQAALADVHGIRVGGGQPRGLIEGSLLGAAVGAAGGALFGIVYIAGADFCAPSCDYARAAVQLGAVGGVLGAGSGLAFGALHGSPTLYTLPPRE